RHRELKLGFSAGCLGRPQVQWKVQLLPGRPGQDWQKAQRGATHLFVFVLYAMSLFSAESSTLPRAHVVRCWCQSFNLARCANCLLEQFDKVLGFTVREVSDLFGATKTIGHNHSILGGSTNPWHHFAFSRSYGDLGFLAGFKPIGSRYPTASAVKDFNIQVQPVQLGSFIVGTKYTHVVAVHLDQWRGAVERIALCRLVALPCQEF